MKAILFNTMKGDSTHKKRSQRRRSPSLYLRFALISFTLLSPACAQEAQKPQSQPETENQTTKTESQDERWTVQRQTLVNDLRSGRYRIKSDKVLAAMGKTPRHEFMPDDVRNLAYADRPLPIGHNQTISQPYIVAFMTEQLEPEAHERVLEIGTGSGYQAAVLSELVKEVYTIEIVEPLAKSATETLERLDYQNVHVKAGDGYQGWPEHAPFDAIIVTCAPNAIPEPLVEQLKEGGRMIIPVGPVGGVQELYLLEKKNDKVSQKAVLPVRFVPMTGKASKKK